LRTKICKKTIFWVVQDVVADNGTVETHSRTKKTFEEEDFVSEEKTLNILFPAQVCYITIIVNIHNHHYYQTYHKTLTLPIVVFNNSPPPHEQLNCVDSFCLLK